MGEQRLPMHPLPEKVDLDPTRPAIFFLGSQMAVGGAQVMLLEQALWFHQNGYRVCAAFFYDREGLYPKWRAEYPFPLYNLESWTKGDSYLNPFRLLRGFWRLYRLLAVGSYQVIETFTHHANLLGLPVAWAAGVPRRIASHHGHVVNFSPLMYRLHRRLINSDLTTGMVMVSERVRRLALEVEGVRDNKAIVIPNGLPIQDDAFVSEAEIAQVHQELGVTDSVLIAITVGRLVVQKGHKYLLQAIPKVLAEYNDVLFVFAGDGLLRTELEQQSRQLGIQHKLRFLGTRSDVPRLLQAADLFILPSLWEGLPLALLEAMSAGLPVVGTQVEGVEEILVNERNGLLVPVKDPDALSEAIIRLLRDPMLRDQFGHAGKQLVIEYFTIEHMCRQYEDLFVDRRKLRS